jgi:hypothetical protein
MDQTQADSPHRPRRRVGALLAVAIVGFGAVAASESPSSPSSTVAAGEFTSLLGSDPPPLRVEESEFIANRIRALELAPGKHRVRVEYEELSKRKVPGFESRETYTPRFVRAIPRSRCVLEFDFKPGKRYRVVRSSISDDGALKLFYTDGWGVWLIEAGSDRPLAQCT